MDKKNFKLDLKKKYLQKAKKCSFVKVSDLAGAHLSCTLINWIKVSQVDLIVIFFYFEIKMNEKAMSCKEVYFL